MKKAHPLNYLRVLVLAQAALLKAKEITPAAWVALRRKKIHYNRPARNRANLN